MKIGARIIERASCCGHIENGFAVIFSSQQITAIKLVVAIDVTMNEVYPYRVRYVYTAAEMRSGVFITVIIL